ncbi:three prime repair exonuclease 2 isoform X2 [Xenopus laevis]|nr:three prime repair exonuclease 2 isoform X2 [Xenopus laevis]
MSSPCRSFVFLDLEATGINHDLPKITELCLVAVHVSSLEDPETVESEVQLPRVLDKLCLCVDPAKPITKVASDITGLSNEKLTNCEKPCFDLNLVQLVKEFLNRQAQPVCLVAHNGFFYDYPLLKAEFQQQNEELPSSLFCLDSLKAFRQLDKQDGRNQKFAKGFHSLSEIYRRSFGKEPIDCHYAEGDVLTLIKVFMHRASEFLEMVNSQSKRWSEISPMYKTGSANEHTN